MEIWQTKQGVDHSKLTEQKVSSDIKMPSTFHHFTTKMRKYEHVLHCRVTCTYYSFVHIRTVYFSWCAHVLYTPLVRSGSQTTCTRVKTTGNFTTKMKAKFSTNTKIHECGSISSALLSKIQGLLSLKNALLNTLGIFLDFHYSPYKIFLFHINLNWAKDLTTALILTTVILTASSY